MLLPKKRRISLKLRSAAYETSYKSLPTERLVCTQARKARKEALEKLQEEVVAHKHTCKSFANHINKEAHAEQKILKMREDAKK